MQHPQDRSHIWAFLSAYIVPPRSHATTDSVGIKTTVCMCLLVRLHACAWVSRLSIYLQPLVWLWSDTWCGCIVPPISAPSLPALSFYRKLIGSRHWCVKLLCVGHRRQLDYLFFIFSLLEQLSSALLLFFLFVFLNEIMFPSVALKDAVCNCSKHHTVGGLVLHHVMLGEKFLLPIF